MVYFFQAGVLFSIENRKFWPIWAKFGYWAKISTFWHTFYRPYSAVVHQNLTNIRYANNIPGTVQFKFFFVRCLCSCCFGKLLCSRRVLSGTRQLATSYPFPRVGFNAAEKTQETQEPDLNNWIGMDGEAAPGGHKIFPGMLISNFFFSRLWKD